MPSTNNAAIKGWRQESVDGGGGGAFGSEARDLNVYLQWSSTGIIELLADANEARAGKLVCLTHTSRTKT